MYAATASLVLDGNVSVPVVDVPNLLLATHMLYHALWIVSLSAVDYYSQVDID